MSFDFLLQLGMKHFSKIVHINLTISEYTVIEFEFYLLCKIGRESGYEIKSNFHPCKHYPNLNFITNSFSTYMTIEKKLEEMILSFATQ